LGSRDIGKLGLLLLEHLVGPLLLLGLSPGPNQDRTDDDADDSNEEQQEAEDAKDDEQNTENDPYCPGQTSHSARVRVRPPGLNCAYGAPAYGVVSIRLKSRFVLIGRGPRQSGQPIHRSRAPVFLGELTGRAEVPPGLTGQT
jgi:hypothetical protein